MNSPAWQHWAVVTCFWTAWILESCLLTFWCTNLLRQHTSVERIRKRGKLCAGLQHERINFFQRSTLNTAISNQQVISLCTVWHVCPAVFSWWCVQKAALQCFSCWHRGFNVDMLIELGVSVETSRWKISWNCYMIIFLVPKRFLQWEVSEEVIAFWNTNQVSEN